MSYIKTSIKSMRIVLPSRISNWLARFLFFATLCIFVIAAVHNLNEFFPYETFDEYAKFRVALKFMRVFFGQDAWGDLLSWPMAADPRMPFLMHSNYVGWPALYVAVGLMSVLGKTFGYFFMFRFTAVLGGVLALCSIWFVLRRWFCEWTAAMAVFLVGCNYSYVQSVQRGFYREEIFQVCGLWFGLALWQMARKRKLFLYLGFFVFGIVLWCKIMFIAYIVGALAVFFVLGPERWGVAKTVFPSLRSVVFSGIAFVCGAAPLVWFNLRHGFPTFGLIFSRMFNLSAVLETDTSWSNGAVLENLMRRMNDFYLYLSDEVLFCVCDDLFKGIYVLLFACACVWGCLAVFGLWGDGRLKLYLRGLFVFYAVVLVLTCFVPYRRHPGHILVLVPFSAILCALLLVHLGRIRGLLFVPVLVCGLWFSEQVGHMYLFSRNCVYDGQIEGLCKGDYDFVLAWLKTKNIRYALCSAPLAGFLYIMGDERDMEFYDLSCGDDSSLDSLTAQIGSRVSDTPVYWLFSCENYVYYSRVKDSAEQYGLEIKIVDIKTLRRNSTYTFVLCLVSRADEHDEDVIVSNGAVEECRR